MSKRRRRGSLKGVDSKHESLASRDSTNLLFHLADAKRNLEAGKCKSAMNSLASAGESFGSMRAHEESGRKLARSSYGRTAEYVKTLEAFEKKCLCGGR